MKNLKVFKPQYRAVLVSVSVSFCVFLAGSAFAKKIYSWEDAAGVKHFSDQPPPDQAAAFKLDARQLAMDPKMPVQLRVEQKPGENTYFAFNSLHAPVQLSVSLENAKYVQLVPSQGDFVLPAQRETQAFSVLASGSAAGYQLSYRITPGTPNAAVDLNAEYRLPFAKGKAFVIHQGFGGAFSHSAPENYHAVDFAMPIGTPIHAARAGIVMQIEEDFFEAGVDKKAYGERANFVAILHTDGSFAIYAHLDLENVMVGLGQRVDVGQLIAHSGNTGFSTGPHLHFVVQRNAGAKLVSVPFKFTIAGQKITPVTGLPMVEIDAL